MRGGATRGSWRALAEPKSSWSSVERVDRPPPLAAYESVECGHMHICYIRVLIFYSLWLLLFVVPECHDYECVHSCGASGLSI